jgi:glycine dehydrogenase subunit 2
VNLIFEKSRPGRRGVQVPEGDVPAREPADVLPSSALREKPAELPEIGELDLVRHYTELAHRNMSVDANFYPLGSCTMKYNPKVHEKVARFPGLALLHPLQPESTAQGILSLIRELESLLAEIGGMDACSSQPASGAQGEFTGLLMIRAYHRDRGEAARVEVIIPDTAHGTNPATCTMVGLRAVQVATNKRGCVDLDALRKSVGRTTAGMMITNPNTLGIFEENIDKVAEIVHEAGGLMYMDGANMNALLGIARPGDFGMDVMHYNLHKTFTIPHGGGGPGAGGVAVKKHLEPYLPIPRVVAAADGALRWSEDFPKSVGKIHSCYGNVNNMVRGYTYLRSLGRGGLRRVSENAVLNANYLLSRLKREFPVAYPRFCMHEFVLSGKNLAKETHVRTLDVAKRLIDFGYHPPTIYFPLIVPEALMIEPTETESRETMDAFADTLIRIKREAHENPKLVQEAPHTTPVRRLDERQAAIHPKVRWTRPA